VNSILASDAIEQRRGFWARQFGASPTSSQIVFDFLFGILMPVSCFYFDPGIVGGAPRAPLGQAIIFIYGFSGLAIVTLFVWIAFGNRLRSLTPIFAGVLLASAFVSNAIGVIIFPLTLIGILFIVGVLGLVPFVTGFVYLRNALRAFRQRGQVSRSLYAAGVVFSGVLAIGLPGAAQWSVTKMVNQSIAEILDEKSGSVDVPVARIKRVHLYVDTDPIVSEYEAESDPTRRERLSRAYKEITGEDIDHRLRD